MVLNGSSLRFADCFDDRWQFPVVQPVIAYDALGQQFLGSWLPFLILLSRWTWAAIMYALLLHPFMKDVIKEEISISVMIFSQVTITKK